MMQKCRICGNIIQEGQPHFVVEGGAVCSSDCYTEMYWLEKVEWSLDCRTSEQEPVFRSKGLHYVIGAEDAEMTFRGYAGQRHFIYYMSGPFAGQLFTTTNLWGQGRIPENFSNELPDNARILTYNEYKALVAQGVPVFEFRNNVDGKDMTQLCTEERIVITNWKNNK